MDRDTRAKARAEAVRRKELSTSLRTIQCARQLACPIIPQGYVARECCRETLLGLLPFDFSDSRAACRGLSTISPDPFGGP